jgi:ATP-dependent DNA helicase RecG
VARATEYLRTPLQYLKGVGPRRAADLARAGLHTIEDLLYRFPLRYEDRGRFRAIAELRPGETATVAGEVWQTRVRETRRRGFKIFEMLVRDAAGGVIRAVWFNQVFLRDTFHPHQWVVLYGKVEAAGAAGLQLTNPQYEIVRHDGDDDGAGEEETVHTGRIVPIYEKTGTLTTRQQRTLVYRALQRLPADLPDPLPEALRLRLGLPALHEALPGTHFPPAGTAVEQANAFRTPAQVRMIFEEFFLFQLGVLLRRRQLDEERKPRVAVVTDAVREAARQVLPFRLTPGQRQALKEIVDDLQRPRPMNRLLQGEVGSGKTIVALLAAIVAMENGFQVAFMAPTEILADQHFLTIRRLLERSRFRLASLTRSTPAARRREIRAELASGALHLVVGTHALLQDPVAFRELGLVIIDEQHRFGVLQRAQLRAKGLQPDVLVMTATPIPRTLALTVYGDLDVSVIRDLPPGRRPVRTTVRPDTRREDVYRFLRGQMEAGRQAYVVYPLVEESEKVDLKAATEMAEHLSREIFPTSRVALLHGRMPQEAKDRIMRAFLAHEIDLLVATTVIEVGIDVPNASVMVVEHAERFGLAQLHQLRGRVGRGPHPSHCILLYQPPLGEEAEARLRAIAETTDGFELAERDLQLRGPGDFFGTRQSGMPTLRFGDLVRDREIMEQARAEAAAWLEGGAEARALAEHVRSVWEARFGLAGVG